MKKHYACVTVLALLMLALTAVLGACGKSAEPESEPEAVESVPVINNNDPYRNVQGKTVGISFSDGMDAGQTAKGTAITEFLRRKGCTVNCVYADGTLEKQITDIDALISSGCNLLIISPAADTGFSKV
ncbi:MAG: hypothetical protein Q4G47_08805, partial [Lachnospiraceae bacterium]|nr:hypothetical protein [Lachnospiraceae bacterium]